jgi:diacylglycerol kinase (ATP)
MGSLDIAHSKKGDDDGAGRTLYRQRRMRLAVIVNPSARAFTRSPGLVSELRALVEARGGRASAFYVTRDLAELDEVAREIAGDERSVVALAGGDGTLMAGLSALALAHGDRPLPAVSLVPAGTVATVARNLGLGHRPLPALRALLEAGDRARTTRQATLRVRTTRGSGEVEERVGLIFGTGLVARFFDVYDERGARGLASALGITARVFAESFVGGPFARRVLEPLPCRIEVDGRELSPRAYSLVCAATVRDLGLHMRVTYRAGERPDRVHLVASSLSPRELGPRCPRVLAGRTIGGREHFDELVSSFLVHLGAELDGGGEGPYVLDGDALKGRSVEVSPGPELRIAHG